MRVGQDFLLGFLVSGIGVAALTFSSERHGEYMTILTSPL
jgi:hypothetical protein